LKLTGSIERHVLWNLLRNGQIINCLGPLNKSPHKCGVAGMGDIDEVYIGSAA
jgi:hypothetical protein